MKIHKKKYFILHIYYVIFLLTRIFLNLYYIKRKIKIQKSQDIFYS